MGCIELGLVLLQVRDELRLTIGSYRRAYESGVRFGLGKAMEAELEMGRASSKVRKGSVCCSPALKRVGVANECLSRSSKQIDQMEAARQEGRAERWRAQQRERAELRRELENVDRMRDYFKSELQKKNQIIEQQRTISG